MTKPLMSARENLPPALIAGAFQTGVLAVRSLRRRGVEAGCFDSDPSMPGFRSVYGPAWTCPEPDTKPDQWLDFMLGLATRFSERPVLIPSSDQFVSAIAKHSDALAGHYIISPGIAIQDRLADKQTQYALAAEHGMPLPRSSFVASPEDAAEFAREAAFPCLMKPTHFREWQKFPQNHPFFRKKTVVADSAERCMANYRLAATTTPEVILQEVIVGPDSSKRVYLSCYDRQGERIAHAMLRELRCEPMGFGPASVTEPIVDPQTDEICDRFLRSIGYLGICEIEMKYDARDGRVKLIEANPRLSGSGDAAPYAGVDLCWLQYLDLIGQRPKLATPLGNDFRHIVVRSDAVAAPTYWCAGLVSWRDIRRSYRRPLAFFDLDRRDWRYSAETIFIAGRSLAKTLLRCLFRRGSFK